MPNRKPEVEGNDRTEAARAEISISDLFDWNDRDGSRDIVSFTLRDEKGGGYLTRNGKKQAEGTTHTIKADDIDDWEYVVGSSGSDKVTLKAIDRAGTSDSDTAKITAGNPRPHDEDSVLLPFNSSGRFLVTQGFQVDNPSHDRGGPLQWGVDFGAGRGTPVHAVAGGIVVYVEDNIANGRNGNSGFGNYITIKLDSGLYVTYAHLQAGSLRDESGRRWDTGGNSRVEANEVIGRAGDTGTVDQSGPHPHIHIHFGTRLDDWRAADPYWDATVADGAGDIDQPVYFAPLGEVPLNTGMWIQGNTPAQVSDWLF